MCFWRETGFELFSIHDLFLTLLPETRGINFVQPSLSGFHIQLSRLDSMLQGIATVRFGSQNCLSLCNDIFVLVYNHGLGYFGSRVREHHHAFDAILMLDLSDQTSNIVLGHVNVNGTGRW